jgi:BON domain
VLAVVCVLAYNYWSGNGWTLSPPSNSGGINAEAARQRGADVANRATAKATKTATKIESAVSEGALSAKITSKMALDDHVKARTINVDTSGSVVTLSGIVESADERARRAPRQGNGRRHECDRQA